MQDINDAGGINGRKIQIDFQDHKCNPKEATSIFEQLVNAKQIKIFTSVACSGTVLSIAPLLEQNNALLLGTITTTPKISGISPFVFRNWASDDQQARLYAKEIKQKNYRKIGIIHEQTDYAQGLVLSIQKYLSDTGIEFIVESFSSDTTDVKTQLTKLKAANADAYFLSPQTVIAGDLVLKQMKELDFKPTVFFVNDNVMKATELNQKYSDILDRAISGDYILPKNEENIAFLKKYKKTYGKDCTQENICVSVYDAIKILADAIENNEHSAKGVQEYLSNLSYDGLSGHISFDENNDRKDATYSLFVIKNGTGMLIAS